MWQQRKSWILGAVAALVVVFMLFYYFTDSDTPASEKQWGELQSMMEIKSIAPKELDSYQSVSGIVELQHWKTAHGASVYFVHVPSLPMVDIEMLFDAGAARDGDEGGAAYLTNELLSDGTKEMNADAVALSFEEVGAQFSSHAQRDQAILQLRSLSSPDQLLPAVKTLAKIVANPAFNQTGFKREQQKALSGLSQQAQLPQYVASKALYQSLYGKGPYANWTLGDENSLKALTPEKVKAFHDKYYVAKNAVVTIVGDVTASEADMIAQTLTNTLPEGEKAPALPPVEALTEKVMNEIRFPSAQTHILIAQPGLKRDDPDYYALVVGNHILGGNGSVTRIFNTVRRKHGLAYSAYSYFLPMREKGPFVIGAQTRNDKAQQSRDLMVGLLEEFVEKGPTEEELEKAKKNLLGGFALKFDSNAAITRQVSNLGFYNLPLNRFNEYKANIEKLTVDDIKKAFQDRVSKENIVIVTVGDPSVPSPDAPSEGARHHSR